MEPGIALVVLVILGIPIALAIWLIVRAVSAGNRIEELSRRVGTLEMETLRLRQEREGEMAKSTEVVPQPKPVAPIQIAPQKPIIIPQSIVSPEIPQTVAPPPIPQELKPEPQIVSESIPPFAAAPESSGRPAPKINWEQFMGVKGFAWVGGLALFLGVAFFVKYSFDNNLVPPELRVAIGFLDRPRPARRRRGDVAQKFPRALANFVRDRRRHSLRRHVRVPLDLSF